MSVLEETKDYLKNPYFKKHEYGDFTAFYVTIAICTVFIAILIVLNVAIGCCSRYSEYWNDKHTGNRWLVSFWTATPHKQPPLDYTEIEVGVLPQQPKIIYQPQHIEYSELQKRESDI